MDIYTFIRNDHMQAREYISHINVLERHHHAQRLAMFAKLSEMLKAHNEAEEATFYTALSVISEFREQIRHSEKEHYELDEALDALNSKDMPVKEWEMAFERFQRLLFNHIAEEEGKIFYQAQQLIPHSLSVELAGQMEHLKKMRHQLLCQAKAGNPAENFYAAF